MPAYATYETILSGSTASDDDGLGQLLARGRVPDDPDAVGLVLVGDLAGLGVEAPAVDHVVRDLRDEALRARPLVRVGRVAPLRVAHRSGLPLDEQEVLGACPILERQ